MSHSVISESASVAAGTGIGQFCVIADSVQIGPGCQIGHHVVIHEGSRIGANVRIDDHTVIGKQPMRAANSALPDTGKQPPSVISDGCIIGTGAVIYAGCQIAESVLVADLATVRERVTVGRKTIVGRGASIESDCTVGAFCKLETNAYITAYSELEDYVFVAPGVLTSNDRFIGRTKERFGAFKGILARRGSRLAVGSVILPGVEISEEAVTAAGSVVVKPTDPRVIYAGVPARPLRQVPDEQLLENDETQKK